MVDGFFPHVERDAQPERAARRAGRVRSAVRGRSGDHAPRRGVPEASSVQPWPRRWASTPEQARALSRSARCRTRCSSTAACSAARSCRRACSTCSRSFRGAPLRALDNPEPELAVARGAVAYGLARRGVGLKIGGGSARSYYLLVEGRERERTAVCVLPRGAEEGEELRAAEPQLRAARRRAGALSLADQHAASTRIAPGELVTPDEQLPSAAGHRGRDRGASRATRPKSCACELDAQLTEVGTLEMSLLSRRRPAAPLSSSSFSCAADSATWPSSAPARVTQLHPRFAEAAALIQRVLRQGAKRARGPQDQHAAQRSREAAR